MKISAKTEYACIAVLELSLRYDQGEPVRIRDIADTHGIPSRFLVQILLQLKSSGLVMSTRGAAGGYQLTAPPAEITLADVMGVIEGTTKLTSNVGEENPLVRCLFGTWEEVAAAEQDKLLSVSFADLAASAGTQSEPMYYI